MIIDHAQCETRCAVDNICMGPRVTVPEAEKRLAGFIDQKSGVIHFEGKSLSAPSVFLKFLAEFATCD